MDIDSLTIGQLKELQNYIPDLPKKSGIKGLVSKSVIIRTYSAGCWFGLLAEKSGNEVILKDARRMFFWRAKKGISLSACALYGVSEESKIVEPVDLVWLEAIEVIPCSIDSIKSLEGAPYVEAR